MRKSPVRHTVRTYKRRTGKTVYQYPRGHGINKTKIANPTLPTVSSIITKAKIKFGTTENPYEAGFLLPDGSLLGSNSKTKGSRWHDHETQAKSLGLTIDKLKEHGAVRFVASSRSLNLEFNKSINEKQWNRITKIFKEDPMQEAIFVDVFDNNKLIASEVAFSDTVLTRYEKPTYQNYLTMQQFKEKYVHA